MSRSSIGGVMVACAALMCGPSSNAQDLPKFPGHGHIEGFPNRGHIGGPHESVRWEIKDPGVSLVVTVLEPEYVRGPITGATPEPDVPDVAITKLDMGPADGLLVVCGSKNQGLVQVAKSGSNDPSRESGKILAFLKKAAAKLCRGNGRADDGNILAIAKEIFPEAFEPAVWLKGPAHRHLNR